MITFQRILAPIDFSPCSDAALNYAVELTEKFGSELILLYVVPDLSTVVPDAAMPVPTAGPDLDEVIRSAEEAVANLIKEKSLARLNPRTDVRIGSANTEIVQAATEANADLIVIGTHGRTGLSHFFLGSVAEKVIRMAKCPVLTVHEAETESE